MQPLSGLKKGASLRPSFAGLCAAIAGPKTKHGQHPAAADRPAGERDPRRMAGAPCTPPASRRWRPRCPLLWPWPNKEHPAPNKEHPAVADRPAGARLSLAGPKQSASETGLEAAVVLKPNFPGARVDRTSPPSHRSSIPADGRIRPELPMARSCTYQRHAYVSSAVAPANPSHPADDGASPSSRWTETKHRETHTSAVVRSDRPAAYHYPLAPLEHLAQAEACCRDRPPSSRSGSDPWPGCDARLPADALASPDVPSIGADRKNFKVFPFP